MNKIILSFLSIFYFLLAQAQYSPRNVIPAVNAFTQIGSNTNSGGRTTLAGANFGHSVSVIGDVDNDGIQDIVVGAPKGDDNSVVDAGGVYVVMLNSSRTVKDWKYISRSTYSGIIPVLAASDQFGYAVAGIGDIDNNGVGDICVGAIGDGANDNGAVYIIRLNNTGAPIACQKIANGTAGISITNGSNFGNSIHAIGDYDGDGIQEIAVGNFKEDNGVTTDAGAIWVLTISSTGTLTAHQKIMTGVGGFTTTLDALDNFGTGITSVGDLDGDGIPDIAVSATGDDDGGSNFGAVYVCLMNSNKTVKSVLKKISQPFNSNTSYNRISSSIGFGRSLQSADFNGDGVKDLFIGAFTSGQIGSAYVYLMRSDGSCIDIRRYGNRSAWNISFVAGDYLGSDFCFIPDLESDGRMNLIIGAPGKDISSTDIGSIYITNLNLLPSSPPISQVSKHHKISGISGNFGSGLSANDNFGIGICPLGDLNNDGYADIGIGAYLNDVPGLTNCGGYWICFLDQHGKISSKTEITSGTTNFVTLSNEDRFGFASCNLGDIDGDGVTDIAVSTTLDDQSVLNAGAVYILFLNTNGTVKGYHKLVPNSNNMPGTFNSGMNFGSAVVSPGDLDNDGRNDLIIAANLDDQSGSDRGAIYVCFLNADGSIKNTSKKLFTGLSGMPVIANGANFGGSLSAIGDYNGDGNEDVLVGAGQAQGRGAVFFIYLDAAGNCVGNVEISNNTNWLGTIPTGSVFGVSTAFLPDMNGDGFRDIAISHYSRPDYGVAIGQIWIAFLNGSGTVIDTLNIGASGGRFYGDLDQDDNFGYGLAFLGDYDGDGGYDLAVGARYDDDGGTNMGAVWMLSLSSVASAKSQFVEPVAVLDGGYYNAVNDLLRFRFEEEYNVVNGSLTYSIYGNRKSYSGPNLNLNRGLNYFTLDVSFLPSGIYTLEVKNSKNERKSLRFKKI